jgi:hypothetical protein
MLEQRIDTNPTELVSVVFGLLHYACGGHARRAKARFHRGKLGGVCGVVTCPQSRLRFPT